MPENEPIICKPTPWFLFRAFLMLAMFSVFAVLFYKDGSTGYRKKNETFYLHKTFQQAQREFSEMQGGGNLTPESWRSYAEKQVVAFPDDPGVLPADIQLPMPWPDVLADHEKMKPLKWNLLWREYTKQRGMNASPPEHAFDAKKIREQWIVFWICAALALIALFFLVRTLGRKLVADGDALTSQSGKRVPYAEMKRLDLRKWETKGLAFIEYEGSSGNGRIRIDGLTYGGFKQENGQPAEALMKRVKSKFSGEILEYAPVATEESPQHRDEGAS
ncbi:MAG: hypothetical protein ACQCXQ_10160 [Verrucomicrobiales bacterium]|nr:hypothetical protein [Verrucomicrobiota bacterium JB025]